MGSSATRQARGRQVRLALQRQRGQQQQQQQGGGGGAHEAMPGGGLLQYLEGGYAPRSDYYLETLKTGIAA